MKREFEREREREIDRETDSKRNGPFQRRHDVRCDRSIRPEVSEKRGVKSAIEALSE